MVIGLLETDFIPHLNTFQMHDTLPCYYEDKGEIGREWKNGIKEAETRRRSYLSVHPDKAVTVAAPKGKKIHDVLAELETKKRKT